MKKYIKVKILKKLTVYNLFTMNDKGIELMPVTIEHDDPINEVVIVRQLADVYCYTLSYQDAESRLLQEVFDHE